MARKEINAIFNDNELNKMNSNFKELYDEFGNVVATVTEKAFDKIVDSAKINWGEPVDTFDDLPSNASNSETRMTRDDGKIYRYDGSIWREIQDIDPTAINEVDSRLSTSLAEKANRLYVESELNRKADLSFVDAQLSSIVSGAPSGTYGTLSALRQAHPNGVSGIYLVLDDGHWYYWNEVEHDWFDGGLYQALPWGEFMTEQDEEWVI